MVASGKLTQFPADQQDGYHHGAGDGKAPEDGNWRRNRALLQVNRNPCRSQITTTRQYNSPFIQLSLFGLQAHTVPRRVAGGFHRLAVDLQNLALF